MKTLRIYYALVIGFLFALSCQREIKFAEGTAAGELSKGPNGECQPLILSGNYRPGATLSDSNFIELFVNVREGGTFNIITASVNGYLFRGTGTFGDTGLVKVKLIGRGRPGNTGTDVFSVNYGGSTCNFTVQVSDVPNTEAVFTLKGSPGQCMESNLTGNFFKGFQMDTSNKITIKADVSTEGTYNIITHEINGYQFSGSGVFLTKGEQLITLQAVGTPVLARDDLFTVNTGASSCDFAVNVQETVEISNENYFPLTAGSYWLYEDLTSLGDTMKRTITSQTSSIDGKEYVIIEEKRRFGGPYLLRYRQDGASYYEFANVVNYTGSLSYSSAVTDEIYFLNQVASAGTGWGSTEFSGTIQGGQTILLQYIYRCLARNSTVTLAGNTFANVNIISVRPQVKSLTNGYSETGEEYIYSYAKGIGIVYMIKIDRGITQWEWRVKAWEIH